MLQRIKNKIINMQLFFKKNGKTNVIISKQKKLFEFSDFQFDKTSKVLIKEGLILKKNISIRCRENAELKIGKNVYFNNNCILTCRKKIVIGNDVSIGPNVCIFDHDHDFKKKDRKHTFNTDEIIIDNNVWIGASAIILKGSHIGENSVIAAGAIVNCNVPENSIFISKDKIKPIGDTYE